MKFYEDQRKVAGAIESLIMPAVKGETPEGKPVVINFKLFIYDTLQKFQISEKGIRKLLDLALNAHETVKLYDHQHLYDERFFKPIIVEGKPVRFIERPIEGSADE